MSGQALFAKLQKLLDTKRLPVKRNAMFEIESDGGSRVVSLTEMTTGSGLRTVLMRADEFEPGSYVIRRNQDNTLTLVGFVREGRGDPLTAQEMINSLPSYSPVFMQFGSTCANDDVESDDDDEGESHAKYKEVVVKFDTQEALDMVDGDGFDTVYDAFNAGLPDGWVVDDSLKPVGEASAKMDHVRYNGGMTPELVRASTVQKRKRTAEKAE